jgi:hypothetical protein
VIAVLSRVEGGKYVVNLSESALWIRIRSESLPEENPSTRYSSPGHLVHAAASLKAENVG